MIQEGVDLVKGFEGFSSPVYQCPASVWTIGMGTTIYPSLYRVKSSDPNCTPEQAEEWLHHELNRCEQVVIRYCNPYMDPHQRAALASFVYNLGSGAFRASTLRRRINSGDWDDVPYQLSRWNMAGGRVLRGLVRRRAAEIDLWNEGLNIRRNNQTQLNTNNKIDSYVKSLFKGMWPWTRIVV